LKIIEQSATLPKKKSVLDFLFGRPLSSDENLIGGYGFGHGNQVRKRRALPPERVSPFSR